MVRTEAEGIIQKIWFAACKLLCFKHINDPMWEYTQCHCALQISGFWAFFYIAFLFANLFSALTRTSILPVVSDKTQRPFAILCGSSSWSRAYTKTQNILECYTPCLLLNIYQQNQSPVRSGILVTLSLHFSACLCCWLKPLAEL